VWRWSGSADANGLDAPQKCKCAGPFGFAWLPVEGLDECLGIGSTARRVRLVILICNQKASCKHQIAEMLQ
jgi:hypothetical protein